MCPGTRKTDDSRNTRMAIPLNHGDEDLPPIDYEVLSRVIVVGNDKGGAGKTTLTTHLGGMWAAAGQRVLLVDLNSQGNMAEDLGYNGSSADDQGEALFKALQEGQPLHPLSGIRPNLDVVPGGRAVQDLPWEMLRRAQHQGLTAGMGALARSLEPIAEDYDLVLVDSPPENHTLQQLALTAARYLLIPVRTDDSSRKGLRLIAKQFALVRQVNPLLALLGVVIMASSTSARNVRAEAIRELENDLAGAAPVFSTFVRYSEALARDVRKRGQLAHELEQCALTGPRSYDVAAGRASRSQVVSASAGSVAGDYEKLIKEDLEPRITQLAALLESVEGPR
jgi:chromosome partitioning protein